MTDKKERTTPSFDGLSQQASDFRTDLANKNETTTFTLYDLANKLPDLCDVSNMIKLRLSYLIGTAPVVVRTNISPNCFAAVSLWRRFFEEQDAKTDDQILVEDTVKHLSKLQADEHPTEIRTDNHRKLKNLPLPEPLEAAQAMIRDGRNDAMCRNSHGPFVRPPNLLGRTVASSRVEQAPPLPHQDTIRAQ